MDLDAFFVAVECKLNSALRGKPLIIGGTSGRGVVASCSYEARRFGVHSAMPMYLARQLCPDAIVISGDMEAYSQHSHLVTEVIADTAPLFEKASIDEFYIDATGMDRFFGTYAWARELRTRIISETGLPISMALSANKLVSKVATGEYKPNGEKHISLGSEQGFLDPLPVQKIPMIGEKTSRFLYDMGVRQVCVLRQMPVQYLESAFGKSGREIWHKAHAIDPSPVIPYSEQKSISTESTFETDTIDVHHLRALLIAMVEKLSYKLRKQGRLAACITIKIRYANFDTVTRQFRLPYTASDKVLIRTALELFDKLYNRRMLIRLVGVRLSHLVYGSDQISLFEDTEEEVKLNQAMDRIRLRHGAEKIMRAITMGTGRRVRTNMNMFKG